MNTGSHTQILGLRSGNAALVAVIFLTIISLAAILPLATIAAREAKLARAHREGKQAFFTAEASAEDVAFRLTTGKFFSNTETLALGASRATTTSVSFGGTRVLSAEGSVNDHVRASEVRLAEGAGASFNYGVQAGNGGFLLENSSSITGNVYANGSITGAGNLVDGDAVSAGAAGLIDDVHTIGDARANTIQDSTIDGDAYYQTISGSTVGGTSNPGSPNEPPLELPISDELVEELKTDAASGGTTTCSDGSKHVIDSSTTIGPTKIPCDLEIKNSSTVVTLNGNIWVEGDISLNNDIDIQVNAGFTDTTVAVIADNESDRLSSSKITINNSTEFFGASGDSYIMLLSQNESSEMGGSEVAIIMKNSATGDLIVYAGHGEVLLENNIFFKEVTAYKIHTKNSANVTYETGLGNVVFSSGPSGGFELQGWVEIQ